ncbi:MAG: PDZ domain-containing protein, partial [Pirellulaceae bacterium]
KGGLQSNDVVLTVDGVPVTEFKDLTNQLRTRRAGDQVKMEIQRDGETLEKTITLGQWPYREEYSLQD